MAGIELKRLCAGFYCADIGATHVRAIQDADGWELQFMEEEPNSCRTMYVQCETLEEAQEVAAAWQGF